MSRLVHLKVKIKSLAAEASLIRAEERKAKRRYRWAKSKLNKASSEGQLERDTSQLERDTSQLNSQHAAATADFWSLREHRVGVTHHVVAYSASSRLQRRRSLREEARISLLAYAFLRGVPYGVVEQYTRSAVDTEAVRELAERFSDQPAGALNKDQKWILWMIATQKHIAETKVAPDGKKSRKDRPSEPVSAEEVRPTRTYRVVTVRRRVAEPIVIVDDAELETDTCQSKVQS
jgi:hypothetical protein